MEITPNVSVIIPHLNQNGALEKCIISLQKQSYPHANVEIIVVDNGSVLVPNIDNISFKKLEVLIEKTPGPGPARNMGVGNSGGKFLFFIDADCVADPNWIKNGVARLVVDSDTILGGEVKILPSGRSPMPAIEAYENIFAYLQETYIIKVGFSGSGNLALNREVFDEVGGFPGIDVAEDRGWGAQALKAGFRFTYCPDMIIFHPARVRFKEIFDKWARHSRHDFSELRNKPWALLKWTGRSAIVFASIPVHSIKVIGSGRLSGVVPKLKAIFALVIIRLYRVMFMLGMIVSKKFRNQDISWNK